MQNAQDPRLREIWKQTTLPVVYKQSRPKPVLVKLPYAHDNQLWLKGDKKRWPEWDPKYKCWEAPQAWFDYAIESSLNRYGKVYVIQLHREMQKCAPACWNAEGFHCECSCMGANHGSGHPHGQWHEVAETFAFSWGQIKYACRLLSKKSNYFDGDSPTYFTKRRLTKFY